MSRASLELSKDETADRIFQGRLTVLQRKTGYRFSLDALLLADFVKVRRLERVIDLGAGNGVIALALASLHPSLKVVGLEIQEQMVRRAIRSAAWNKLQERVTIVEGDVCLVEQSFSPESFDAAVCNPPYHGLNSGRINPDSERRAARHEIHGKLENFLRAASFLLRRGGRMALVYPAARMADLLKSMRGEELEPKRMRLVHSFAGSGAALVLVEGIKGGASELKILPPLVVYTKKRKYTPEMRAILRGG